MKRVTFTYSMVFRDDVSDEECTAIALEVQAQDGNWPNDDDVKIEHLPATEESPAS